MSDQNEFEEMDLFPVQGFGLKAADNEPTLARLTVQTARGKDHYLVNSAVLELMVREFSKWLERHPATSPPKPSR